MKRSRDAYFCMINGNVLKVIFLFMCFSFVFAFAFAFASCMTRGQIVWHEGYNGTNFQPSAWWSTHINTKSVKTFYMHWHVSISNDKHTHTHRLFCSWVLLRLLIFHLLPSRSKVVGFCANASIGKYKIYSILSFIGLSATMNLTEVR